LRRGGRRTRRPPRSAPRRAAGAAVVGSIEFTGPVGSHALEAIRLEVRALAQACGLDLRELRVETRAERGSA